MRRRTELPIVVNRSPRHRECLEIGPSEARAEVSARCRETGAGRCAQSRAPSTSSRVGFTNSATVLTNAGTRRASAAQCASAIARTLGGYSTKPMASAPDSTAASTCSSSRSPQILMRVRACEDEPFLFPIQFETGRDDADVAARHGSTSDWWKRNRGMDRRIARDRDRTQFQRDTVRPARRSAPPACGRVGRSVRAASHLAGGRYRCRPARRRYCGSCDAGRRRHENRSAAPRRAAARRPNGWS